MTNLVGRSALVTGATTGVGAVIAEAFARAGANVVLHGLHDGAQAQAALRSCRDAGVEADLVFGDLTEPTEQVVEAVYGQAMQLNDQIDILVNNAGGYFDVPFLDLSFDLFLKTMRLNVHAPFFLTQRFARGWVAAGVDGRVLMIGSINGELAEPGHAAYDTSKGAVRQMVRTLCAELAPYSIRVNGLAPGLFRTQLTEAALQNPHVVRWMELHTPNGRVPGPEVAGDAAVFLVSDGSAHIHGQMLNVDGGMSVWQQPDAPVEKSPGIQL